MSISSPYFNALILGYTGATGQALLVELVKSDKVNQIICLGRSAPAFDHHKLQFVQADLSQLTHHLDVFASVSRVYCCLGTTIAKAGSKAAFRKVDYDMVVNAGILAAQAGVAHFSVVSAISAAPQSAFFYNRVKGEMEMALRKMDLKRLSIYQPGLIMAKRSEKRIGEMVAIAIYPWFSWLLPMRYRGIGSQTIAKAMLLNSIKTDEGVEVLTNGDMEVLAKSL